MKAEIENRLVEKTGQGGNSLRTKKLTRIKTRVTSEASRELEDLGSLESSKIGKVREMNPPSAFYRRRNWVGVILPKI